MGKNNVFNVQIFFIVFRETLEAVIVVSVLLAFLKQGIGNKSQEVYKRLVKQVWLGAILGVVICLVIGCAFIGAYYSLGNDIWSKSEDLWEGIFCIIATVLISIMGIALLRVNKMQEKWRVKIARAIVATPVSAKTESRWKLKKFNFSHYMKKYALFILPFVTCLREGLEAVVFVGGVGIGTPASSFPLPVFCGLVAGCAIGGLLYMGGSAVSLQIFLCISTAILYLLAAGLFSRGVWDFETYRFNKKTGGDASESGNGPGSYNIKKSVWHVNCCNPETDNGWDVFNSLLGWQNSATYGSVLAYNCYWIAIMVTLGLMYFEERNGHLPFLKGIRLRELNPMYHIKNKKQFELNAEDQERLFREAQIEIEKQVAADKAAKAAGEATSSAAAVAAEEV